MDLNNNWSPIQGKYYDIDIDLNYRTYEVVELDEKTESAIMTLEKIEKILGLNFKPFNFQESDKVLKTCRHMCENLQKEYNCLFNSQTMEKVNALHIRIERALYPSISLQILDEIIQLVLNFLPFKDLITFCEVNRHANQHGIIDINKRAKELGHNGCDAKSSNVFFKQIFEDFYHYQIYGNEESVTVTLENIIIHFNNLKNYELFKFICDGWHDHLFLLVSTLKKEESLDKKMEDLSQEEGKLGEWALIEAYKKNLPLDFLLNRGAKINANSINDQRYSFLQLAVKKNDYEMVKKLLTQKPDVDWKGINRERALHYAKTIEIATLLIESGADINKNDTFGRSLLHSAKTPEMIKFYLDKGLDINQCDGSKWTPLHHAVIGDYGYTCVKLLLENGAAINSINSRGYTALQEAKNLKSSDEIIRLLEKRKTLTTDCVIF